MNKNAEIWTSRVKELFRISYTDENNEPCYRLYQHKLIGNPKRRKQFQWIKCMNPKALPQFPQELDSWMSFGVFHKRFNKKGFLASINCNFLFLSLRQLLRRVEKDSKTTANHKYNITCLTSLYSKTLERCHEKNLPEPEIIYTADGLQLIWHWKNSMKKINYPGDIFGFRFNDDWDDMQNSLYEIFQDLGADPRKKAPTAMFRIPGSINTVQKLQVKDRVVKVIHQGQILDSYVDMQNYLNIKTKDNNQITPEEQREQEIWEEFKDTHYELAKDFEDDILKIHQPSQNFTCLAFISNGQIQQHWTKASKLKSTLARITQWPDFKTKDVYVSQAQFSQKRRKINCVCSVNLNFLDLDFKILKLYHPHLKANPSPSEWLDLVYKHIEKINGCYPTVVVFTGGGIHLKWIYDNPINTQNLIHWQYLQKILLSQFRTLGADPASIDAARILRLEGSINHKNSEHIYDHNVKVIHKTLDGETYQFENLLAIWENSKLQNPQEIQELKTLLNAQLEELNKPDPDYSVLRNHLENHITQKSQEIPENIAQILRNNIIKLHNFRHSWINLQFPDGCSELIKTSQLDDYLKFLYPHSEVSISAAEFEKNKLSSSAIQYLPCNYLKLTACPGDNISQQIENIIKRCQEYRNVGIPAPNQIIRVNNTLFLEWIYNNVLPGYALPRWAVTQEFLARFFEDWGAVIDNTTLIGTSCLPLPGLYYDGTMAELVLNNTSSSYSFDKLATAVLPFSQEEVEEYENRKKEELTNFLNLKLNFRKILNMVLNHKMGFAIKAKQRYYDLMKLMDLRKDQYGNVPQGSRELFVFYAALSAIQAGLIQETQEDIIDLIQSLINHCGSAFADECSIQSFSTIINKFLRGDHVIYKVKNITIIDNLKITPKEQKLLTTFRMVPVQKKQQEPRDIWLAKHSTEREKPWLKLNISRATWFRRLAAQKLADDRTA